ncbi:MAG: hypothetical protein ACXVAG_01960 [Vulcanimicrobiaceae bacterium]
MAVELARQEGVNIATFASLMNPAQIAAIQGTGRRCIMLGEADYAESVERVQRDAAGRRALLARALPTYVERLGYTGEDAARFSDAMLRAFDRTLHAALQRLDWMELLHEREGVAGVLLYESEAPFGKSIALWAKQKDIPVFVLSHGANLNRPYTIIKDMCADYVLVFGERGAERYLEAGFPRDRIFVTGNPAWDRIPRLATEREQIRSEIYRNLGVEPDLPLITFGTTWTAKLTALEDATLYERTLRSFLTACKALRERGERFMIVVKDRPPNAEFGAALTHRIGEEIGLTDFRHATGDLARLLAASSVFVGYDTSSFVESMMLDVPAVNIWAPSSWFIAPALDRDDGIPMVRYENANALAGVLGTLLTNTDARAELVAAMKRRLPRFNVATGGAAMRRCVDAISPRLRRPSGTPAADSGAGSFVWQSLSKPNDHHPNEARRNVGGDLLQLIVGEPRTALEVYASTPGLKDAIRARFPSMNVESVAGDVRVDLGSIGIAQGGVDLVLLPEALASLYDPWDFLKGLRPSLSRGAQVLATLPNVRNVALLEELIKGRWNYARDGVLDISKIRFFTRKSIYELFEQTGYRITRLERIHDPRVPVPDRATAVARVDAPSFRLDPASFDDLDDLRTLEFLVDARPA